MINFPPDYPELLADLAAHLYQHLTVHGIDAPAAETMARASAEHIRQHWGGIEIYFPKGLSFEISQRNAEIWRKFNGENTDKLAREYKLTERQVTSIIAEQRALDRRRRQQPLFNEETKQ